MSKRDYVLGTGADELARLALQHRLWADAAHDVWKRARIDLGDHVLDVGCGPGHASFDLAQLVTPSGRVVGVDESSAFVSYLNEQAGKRGLPQLSGVVGDVHDLGVGEGEFDLAYARWVLCFVKDPARVVRSVARALKPGGRFCVHDYFDYRSMTMAPRRRALAKAVAATASSWEERGGDTDVMGRFGRLCEGAGLKLEHVALHHRVARGSDTMFIWVDVWWRIFAPKLVEMGRLTAGDVEELIRDLDEIKGSSTDFIVCPPVYEMIAVKA